MKPPPNPRRPPNINTKTIPESSITTPDFQIHLGRLKDLSAAASKILAVVGDQLTWVSFALPVHRGYEAVNDLKVRAHAHRTGLETAFDPLRGHLDHVKANFWAKNGERLEAYVRNYVERRIKERVMAEVDKELERYRKYLDNKEANNRKLVEAVQMSCARTHNSILRSKYPAEPVAWIGNLPDGIGPVASFTTLICAERNLMIELAESLGLSTTEEGDQVDTLNKVMRYLGIGYQSLPSRTGVLLMPVTANL